MKKHTNKRRYFVFGTLIMPVLLYAIGCKQEDKLGDGLFAQINTDHGTIVVQLEYEKTPLTVTNFVALAEGTMDAAKGKPFYDGLTFHRVISRANGDESDFMIQGGDPEGTGAGGPGYRFPDEFDPSLTHDGPGILSMANAGPGTNGSQFFITIVATPHLNGRHTVFGHVVKGQDVVNSMKRGEKIKSIKIIRNGAAAKAFIANQERFDALLSDSLAFEQEKKTAGRDASIKLIEQKFPAMKKTDNGIYYEITKEGSGAKHTQGTFSVNYTLTLLSGEQIDSSEGRGPFEFVAGQNMVIPGWEESVLDMRPGERRTVVLPPELAYGERGAGGVIPPNSFLVFQLELLGVK